MSQRKPLVSKENRKNGLLNGHKSILIRRTRSSNVKLWLTQKDSIQDIEEFSYSIIAKNSPSISIYYFHDEVYKYTYLSSS